jgi:hypothetical protein
MKTLVVGCPVYERAWVLDTWFEALLKSIDGLGEPVETALLMNYADSEDGTREIIGRWAVHFDSLHLIYDHGNDHEKQRAWRFDRYVTMSRLRNKLLESVREIEPDYYLSLDTDMILQPDTLKKLFEALDAQPFDGIAPMAYMTPRGTTYPNAINSDLQTRPPLPEGHPEVVPVSVCFGTVLMRPSLYNGVDYSAHNMGEDIGWGKSALEAGLSMALHTGAKIKHVMTPEMLREVDPRVGY